MKRMLVVSVLLLLFCLTTIAPPAARAAPSALPSGFTRIALGSGLSEPTAIVFPGRKKMFVTEKGGAVRIVKSNGVLVSDPLVTFHVNTESERGLLGIALDPDYAANHAFYVYYTTAPGAKNYSGEPKNRVSRLNPRKNKPGFREKIILDQIPSDAGNHNGGDIHFGFDGKLYISVGDSGCGACHDQAQTLDSLRGKILRINGNGTIPTDNPFYNTPGARKEIYAYGFRNPWRFGLRSSNQTYIVADVGEGTWEEIDSLEAGGNFGWNNYEGPCLADTPNCNPNTTDFGSTIKPIHWYNHSSGSEIGNVIAGGVFAENSNYPAPYANAYFYGDEGAGWVHYLTLDGNNHVLTQGDFDNDAQAAAFGRGRDGNVYAVSYGAGAIYKYVYTP